MNSGNPTIVALYVLKEYRSEGVGTKLLEAAIDHMITEEMFPIRIDATNSKVTRMVKRLPAEKQEYIDLYDFSNEIIDKTMEM